MVPHHIYVFDAAGLGWKNRTGSKVASRDRDVNGEMPHATKITILCRWIVGIGELGLPHGERSWQARRYCGASGRIFESKQRSSPLTPVLPNGTEYSSTHPIHSIRSHLAITGLYGRKSTAFGTFRQGVQGVL